METPFDAVKSLKRKDIYTYQHSINVGIYSKNFALFLGSCDPETVFTCALFHDIGKLFINNRILKKKGRLTPEEFDAMKLHSCLSMEYLMKRGYNKEIYLSVYHHHEKYDGTGYPAGLKGDQIPLISQIISLCDCFDAMTSKRHYRNAMSHKEALDNLKASGGQFNPWLLDIFVSCINDIVYLPASLIRKNGFNNSKPTGF